MNIQPFHVKRSSSFYGPLLILPKARRDAMMVLYGFCRAVDDIADSDKPADDKMKVLDEWQHVIEHCEHPQVEAIIADYNLNRSHFHGIIEGMRMDVRGEMICPSQSDLLRYCDYVAGCVGQIAIHIFGAHHPSSTDYAIYLGRALQLTNILRDVRDDARMGRIYLPREVFEQTGIALASTTELIHSPSHYKAIYAAFSEQAKHWFASAQQMLNDNDRKALYPAQMMAMLYENMLNRMIEDDWRYQKPYRVTRRDKITLIWNYLRS